MRFLCVACNYIYDEARGDVVEGITPGTCIDDIDEDVLCPGCEGSFDEFAPIEDEVIYADNPQNLSFIEKEHIPFIDYIDEERLEVRIGEEMHSVSDDHRITAIFLLDESGDTIEEVFILPDEDPIAEFEISGIEKIELRASCSKHGLWSTGLLDVESRINS